MRFEYLFINPKTNKTVEYDFQTKVSFEDVKRFLELKIDNLDECLKMWDYLEEFIDFDELEKDDEFYRFMENRYSKKAYEEFLERY